MAKWDVSAASEWVEIFDHMTGHSIICATKGIVKELLRHDKLAYLRRKECHSADGECPEFGTGCGEACDCPCHDTIIYVAKRALLFMPGSKCFAWDEMPGPKGIESIARIIVDYATYLAIQLHFEPQVIIHCANSRSRSPNVILAFLLLFRSMETHVAMSWLRRAFQQQRPDASRNSPEFPNFSKFQTVLRFLERKKVEYDSWLSLRIQ